MSLFFYLVGNTEDKIKYILTAYLLNAKQIQRKAIGAVTYAFSTSSIKMEIKSVRLGEVL